MTDGERMEREMAHVRELLGRAAAELEAEQRDPRFFASALLAAAVQIHVEIEGTEGLQRAIARLAAWEMVRAGEAGRS